jgi:tetratricopeptide (TPR) repeat protein/SAM-dependent methyltransferase/ADP-ribose pyrophosphatase YjhB (NUDIX family)
MFQAALFFDPVAIPQDELFEAAAQIESVALDELMNVGLLHWREDTESSNLRMHDLIHQLGNRLHSGTSAAIERKFVKVMIERLFLARNYTELLPIAMHIRNAVIRNLQAEDILSLVDFIFRRIREYDLQIVDTILAGNASVRLWSLLYEHGPVSTEPGILGLVRVQLGKARLRMGQVREAQEHLAAAADLLSDEAYFPVKITSLSLLADIFRGTGKPRKAIELLNEAIGLARAGGVSRRRLASLWRKLSHAHQNEGGLTEAHKYITKALKIREELGATNDRAYDTCRLGTLFASMGHLELARATLEAAVRLRERGGARESAFIAYDLNRLGDVLRRLGELEAAERCLERALSLHERFYGRDTPPAAIDRIRLAEMLADKGMFDRALTEATMALKVHSSAFGMASVHCAYDHEVLARISRLTLRSGEPPATILMKARGHALQALEILKQASEDQAIYEISTRRECGTIEMLLGNGKQAIHHFRKARLRCQSLGLTREAETIDGLTLSSLFQNGSLAWGKSASEYHAYLNAYPECLLARLTDTIVAIIADLSCGRAPTTVLDFCCGTGQLAATLAHRKVPVRVIGLDCPGMLSIARQRGLGPEVRFRELTADWAERLPDDWPMPSIVVLGMCLFQFSPIERQLILRDIRRIAPPDSTLLLSIAGPDFEFPTHLSPGINATNPFKATLYNVGENMGVEFPRTLDQALSPVFAKEDTESLRHLFHTCGFELTGSPALISHTRSLAEHVAFARIPVLSQKTFGGSLPDMFWDKMAEIGAQEQYQDTIYGAVFSFRRSSASQNLPVFFIGELDEHAERQRVHYAAAAIVRDKKGAILLAKRGERVRDFPRVWSLPSAMVDAGEEMEQSIAASLKRHFDIAVKEINLTSFRLAPRPTIKGANWIIGMCLFEVTTDDIPRPISEKYTQFKFVADSELTSLLSTDESVGDCMKSLLDLARSRAVEKLGAV